MVLNIEVDTMIKKTMENLYKSTYVKFRDSRLKKANHLFLEEQNRLEKFKNLHKGQRCFIIGTGPSLEKTNIDLIKNEILFGVNTFFNHKNSKNCDYFATGDIVIWKRHWKETLNLSTNLFLISRGAQKYLLNKEKYQQYQKADVYPIRSYPDWDETWDFDITKGIYGKFGTIILAACIPIAYYMGFKEVYLLGCDCDYSQDNITNQHFDGTYQKRFFGGKVAYTDRFFKGYQIWKDIFEKDGRKIYNSTVGGKLDVFERKKLEDVVK